MNQNQPINLKKNPLDRPYESPSASMQFDAPRRRSGLRRLVIFLVIFGALLGGYTAWQRSQIWRAVFLTNNQVYFGRFLDVPFSSSIALRNVYYLQIAQQIQPGAEGAQPEIKLVKLGNEIHGPDDMMVIPKSHIFFWENLQETGFVAKAIAELERSRK